MTINEYYLKLKTLRLAQDIIKDIDILANAINNFNEEISKRVITYITTKYHSEIDELGALATQIYVINGSYKQLYKNTSAEDMINELGYLIECLVIIGCVKYRFENSYEELLEKLE